MCTTALPAHGQAKQAWEGFKQPCNLSASTHSKTAQQHSKHPGCMPPHARSPAKKAEETAPLAASSQANCSLMGRMATLMAARSAFI